MQKISHDSETLAVGQQVITAVAFIVHEIEGMHHVFLPKRAETKKFLPGVYELPGGHIDFKEDIVIGLKREVREEFEKEIVVGDPFYVFTYSNEIKQSHSIEVVYLAKFLDGIDGIQIHPEDHSEYVWADEKTALELYLKKGEDDLELPAIKKGFALLRGEGLAFG